MLSHLESIMHDGVASVMPNDSAPFGFSVDTFNVINSAAMSCNVVV